MKKTRTKTVVIFFAIILIFILTAVILFYYGQEEEDDKEQTLCVDPHITSIINVVLNNETGYYELKLPPIKDENGDPVVGAYVSIELNNITFNNYTNSKGHCTLMIHRDLVVDSELIGDKILTISAEVYDNMNVTIQLEYP
jgi:hypothetical protein